MKVIIDFLNISMFITIILRISNDREKVLDAYDKFPDFFRIGTFIDSTRMKL